MRVNNIWVAAMIASLCGCSAMPDKLKSSEMVGYSSIHDLVSHKLYKSKNVEYGSYLGIRNEIIVPYNYINDFCHYKGGKLSRVKANKFPLRKPHPEYEYGQETAIENNKIINSSFGEFLCVRNKEMIFGAHIFNNGTSLTSHSGTHKTTITIEAFTPSELVAQKRERMALNEAKKKEEANQNLRKAQESEVMLSTRGLKICQEPKGSSFIYVGYVEDSTDKKIKIHVSFAVYKPRPGYTSDNFKASTIWDYPANWYICE